MKTKKVTKKTSTSFPLLTLLFAILGYFVYGGLEGALGIAALHICLTLLCLVCLVPVVGLLVYWLVATDVIIPSILELAGLSNTWLTGVVFAFNFAFAVVITAVLVLIIASVMAK